MNKEEIIAKAMEILEKTKNEQEKYKDERKIMFKFVNSNEDSDIEYLESIIYLYEKMANLEKTDEKYKEIKTVITELKEQHTRRSDDNNENHPIHLFLIKDKNGEKYAFFTRENANKYIDKNKELFDENIEISVSKVKNIDLEKIIDIVMM